MKDQILEQSQNLSWVGATVGVVGGITLTEWMALGGFILALIGAAVNFWHKYSLVQLERKRFEIETQKDESS